MIWRYTLLLIFTTRCWACMCSLDFGTAKQAWRSATAVFLGTVELADPDDDPSQTIFQAQYVRIHVDENFKSVVAGQTIELHQGGNECAAKFRTGQRFVFYLQQSNRGEWYVQACTYSLGSAEPAGDDLLFLRGLPHSAVGTRLSGRVSYHEAGLSNITVNVKGRQGVVRELKTNSSGVFETYGLPPGKYSVKMNAPPNLKVGFPSIAGSPPVPGDGSAVQLPSDGGVSASFDLMDDTRMSGRMLDTVGAPVAGICLDLEPLDGLRHDGISFFNCSKSDGAFEMEMMPPGKYRVLARDSVKLPEGESKSTLYYPGVRNREQASIVLIEPGSHLEHLDIHLPLDEKRYQISGRLRFSDGVPVNIATLTFADSQHGYVVTTSTGKDGAFSLPIVAGMNGQLTAEVLVPQPTFALCPMFRIESRRGIFGILKATPISLTADSDQEAIKLEVPSPSCKSLR